MGERDTIAAIERNIGKLAYEVGIRSLYITQKVSLVLIISQVFYALFHSTTSLVEMVWGLLGEQILTTKCFLIQKGKNC